MQKTDEELIELQRKNALAQEQVRREQAQRLIDLEQSLSEKQRLIKVEAERQAQAITDLEADYQKRLEAKQQKHAEAVASIAAELKNREVQSKIDLEQQQTLWAEEEAELDRQLVAGASRETFIPGFFLTGTTAATGALFSLSEDSDKEEGEADLSV